jgi:hypothetical protein
MRVIPIYDYAGLTSGERQALETEIESRRTLADVLAWARETNPPGTVAEIVTQDEYTHDVVVEVTGRPYLVFDTT